MKPAACSLALGCSRSTGGQGPAPGQVQVPDAAGRAAAPGEEGLCSVTPGSRPWWAVCQPLPSASLICDPVQSPVSGCGPLCLDHQVLRTHLVRGTRCLGSLPSCPLPWVGEQGAQPELSASMATEALVLCVSSFLQVAPRAQLLQVSTCQHRRAGACPPPASPRSPRSPSPVWGEGRSLPEKHNAPIN